MTDKITVPRETWDALREALEEIICAHPVTSTMRQVHAIVAGRNALTAANAVSVEPQAQIPPEGSERAEALIKAMLKEYGYPANPTNAARAGYRAARLAAHPQSQGPEVTPTTGMSIAQRILHVGGRNNKAGYIEFGSIQAVEALVRQVLRDIPFAHPQATEPSVED